MYKFILNFSKIPFLGLDERRKKGYNIIAELYIMATMPFDAYTSSSEVITQMNRPDSNRRKNKDQRTRRNIVFSISTVVFAVLVLVFYVISNLPAVGDFLSKVISIFTPLIGGAALAYLCNPILNFFERRLLRRVPATLRRMLGIFLTYLFFILVIAAIGLLIIPQLINSFQKLFAEYENYIANAITNLNQLISNIMGKFNSSAPDGTVEEFISLEKINALIETLIGNADDLFSSLLGNLQSYGAQLFSTISNAILSLFISFYLLASKETRLAQIRKLITALFNEKHAKLIFDTAKDAHTAFGGFLGGKLLDALIVGIIEFIAFTIFRIPYAPMLATIMGVLNIIPFFGPLIGAIPAGFIVLISDPSKIIIFIIITLVIQQIDGNIIEPKVLGNRTGVSSLCVITSIAIMGNLWGIFGMIIGVPLFKVVIALVQQYANAKLAQKGLSDDLDDYYDEEEECPPRLSKRYHLALIAYTFTPRSKRGEKPVREDYYIHPRVEGDDDQEIEQEEAYEIDTQNDASSAENASGDDSSGADETADTVDQTDGDEETSDDDQSQNESDPPRDPDDESVIPHEDE